ncbi:hypothetical protein ACTJLD_37645, partial [Burkholderia sp. 22088]|uniref:hypothetical protein n=1 Tax=Burkholderia sp. 22088 TaxID=3453871 RepID=UPI003F839F56
DADILPRGAADVARCEPVYRHVRLFGKKSCVGLTPGRADRRVMLLANTSSNRFVSSQSLRSALPGASASPLLA